MDDISDDTESDDEDEDDEAGEKRKYFKSMNFVKIKYQQKENKNGANIGEFR